MNRESSYKTERLECHRRGQIKCWQDSEEGRVTPSRSSGSLSCGCHIHFTNLRHTLNIWTLQQHPPASPLCPSPVWSFLLFFCLRPNLIHLVCPTDIPCLLASCPKKMQESLHVFWNSNITTAVHIGV